MPFLILFFLLALSQILVGYINTPEGVEQVQAMPRQYRYDYYPWRDNLSILYLYCINV